MKKFFFLLAAATLLASCAKVNQPGAASEKQAVRFTVANLNAGSLMFRSTVAIGETGSSDVGIYAADLGANNVKATVSGTALTPSTTIYWKPGQTTASTFIARYPYADGASVNGAYTIPADQSDIETFSYQENFMTAVQSASPTPGTVAFNFTHPFAKAIFNITNNLGADAVASVVFKGVKQEAATLDMSSAPAAATLAETTADVTAYKVSDTQFALILMPQASAAGMELVVTTSQGSVYTFGLSGSYTFEAGKNANAYITLDPIGGGSLDLTAVGAMSFTTSDWTDGADASLNETGETLGNYCQIGGTVYIDADAEAGTPTVTAWEKWYNMTLTAADTWSVTINYDETMTTDETAKGLLVRRGETYFKMYNGSDNIGTEPYTLYPEDAEHTKNVRLPAASGKYLITFNSTTNEITASVQ